MDNFIQKANEKHNNKYDYSNVDYKNNHTKVIIICPEHGEFQQSPMSHLLGCEGCKDCQLINENKKKEKNRKKNEENFLSKAKIKYNNKYDYSKVKYVNNSTKVTIICASHGDFFQTPAKHISGQECQKCRKNKTTEISRSSYRKEFLKKAKDIHGDKYDYSKIEYKSNRDKITIICSKHGEFKQAPAKHISGQGCPRCGSEAVGEARRSNTEEFIQKSKEVNGDKYDYSNTNYKGAHSHVSIRCIKHDIEFKQAPTHHLSGKTGCGKCSGGDKQMTTKKVIKRFKEVHGDKYDYSKVEYIKTNHKVIIICPIHGEFEKSPKKHTQGQGCSICSGCDKNITTEKIIKRFKEVHGDKYDYSKVEYVKTNQNVRIICPIHGEFKQSPSNHLGGKGCGKCMYCPNCLMWRTLGKICNYCKPKKNNKLYQKTKEYKVVEYMRNNIDKEFVHNKSVGDDCTKNDRENTNGHLYPDLRWDCGWFQLILEVDEFQHRGSEYKCDERRMMDIIAKLGMPCVFIRYNPDSKDSNLDVLKSKIEEYLEEEYVDNSDLDFGDFGLITEYLYYK